MSANTPEDQYSESVDDAGRMCDDRQGSTANAFTNRVSNVNGAEQTGQTMAGESSEFSESGSVSEAGIDASSETLCTAGGTLIEFDNLLRAALDTPLPEETKEESCRRIILRLSDLGYVQETVAAESVASAETPENVEGEELPGQIGPYQLLHRLGHGGMGTVYKARHIRLNKIAAVKVLHQQRLHDMEHRSRFDREMRVLGQLTHPNIVSAQHADEADGVPYLAMDFVEGIPLSSLLRPPQGGSLSLSIASACELIHQAAVAIEYAHERGILHRDLKPGNLMLDPQGRVLVLDLGLARIMESVASSGDREPSDVVTDIHQVIGTPGYMAPEQFTRGDLVNRSADVYALGATLFFLLTGRKVHSLRPSESIVQFAMRVVSEDAPDVRELRSDVPRELAELIKLCLQRDPDKRIASAGSLARSLSGWSSANSVLSDPVVRQALSRFRETSDMTELSTTAVAAYGSRPLQDRTQASAKENPAHANHATVIMPRRDRTRAGGRFRSPRSRLLAAAGFICFTIVLGITLKLRTPDGGELIIHSDNPQAGISVVATRGTERKPLEIDQESGNRIRLSDGIWDVRIEGSEAAEFELSEDRVVIDPGTQKEIRIIRRLADAARAGSAENPQPSASRSAVIASPDFIPLKPMRPAMESPLSGGTAADAAVRRDVLWQPGRADGVRGGLVAQPAALDNIFDWQMHFLRQPGAVDPGDVSMPPQYRSSLDPRGELVASADPYGIRVFRLSDGKLVHWHPVGAGSSIGIRFSPTGDRYLIFGSSKENSILIRRRDGRLLSELTLSDTPGLPEGENFRADWIPGSDLILAWTSRGAQILNFLGQSLHAVKFPYESRAWVTNVSIHPNGNRILFAGDDSHVLEWSVPDDQLREKLTLAAGSCRAVSWTPDGDRILLTAVNEMPMSGESSSLWSDQGELICETHDAIAHPVAWSPDREYLVDSTGRIFRAGTLVPVRTAPFAQDDPCRDFGFVPGWPDNDEIIVVSRPFPFGQLFTTNGVVRRFRPSGRVLSTFEHPQPLTIGAVHFDAGIGIVTGSCISSIRGVGIGQWHADGSPESLAFSGVVARLPWTHRATSNGCVVVPQDPAGPSLLISPDGRVVRTFSDFEHGPIEPSPDGRFFAGRSIHSDSGKHVVRVVNSDQDPVFVSEPFTVGPGPVCPLWSPDSRWLMWDAWDEALSAGISYVLDLNDLPLNPKSVVQPATRISECWYQFSPDSRWLAISRGTGADGHGLATVIHLESLQKFDQAVSPSPNVRTGGWSADSTLVHLTRLCSVDVGSGLRSLSEYERLPWHPAIRLPVSVDQSFWAEDQSRIVQYARDGTPVRRLNTPGSPYQPPGVTSIFSDAADGNQLSAVMTFDERHSYGTCIGVVNFETAELCWTGIAYDDGVQISLSPAGEVLVGPEEIDRYVAHTIHYPGGRIIPVTRGELIERSNVSAEKRAVLWATDLNLDLRHRSQDVPWQRNPDAAIRDLPAAAEFSMLDLSGMLEVSEPELAHLREFSGLKSLRLSRTPVAGLPDLSSLESLEDLDLSSTGLISLGSIENLSRLRSLNVSETPLSASELQKVGELKSLENLDLSFTRADAFLISELASLNSLRKLDVRDTLMTPDDVAQLKKKLPNCDVISE